MIVLFVAAGAALGGSARYALGLWVQGWAGSAFPWATLTINALGCLLVGFSLGAFEGSHLAPEARAFVTAGLLGGFTTFSAFSFETVALMRAGEWFRATAYSVGSVGIGIGAVFIGLNAAAIILRARG